MHLLLKSALTCMAIFLAISTVDASSCQVKASRAYVKAIASHSQADADAVPLENSVVRYEGPPGISIESASGASNLRESIVSGPSSYTVDGVKNLQYTTLNSTAIEAIYTIDV